MEVSLIDWNNRQVDNIAAATCVGYINSVKAYVENYHSKKALASNHTSILEHLFLSFKIKDVSRTLLAQITRHRHFSFSVESQRYVQIDIDKCWYTVPKSIEENTDASYLYSGILNTVASAYKELLALGIPLEDARAILPNATKTNFIISMNARAFIEACSKRLCNKAQEEIKELFGLMKETIKDVYPQVYELCNPLCITDKCKEAKPCK